MKRHLIVFAKAPRLGQVKRRLARDIGDAAALAFYRRALARLLRRVARDGRWRASLVVTPDRAAGNGRLWPARLRRLGQGRGDLGARMARALRALPPGPACLIGADIPDIDAGHIWRAFRALGGADLVLGPAEDGGYWLVGTRCRAALEGLFARVRWSTRHALADTRANARGRRVALADLLQDIDDAAALRRWKAR